MTVWIHWNSSDFLNGSGKQSIVSISSTYITESLFSSMNEMDEVLIKNWNQEVGYGDTIYHLGDFTLLGKNPAKHFSNSRN